MLRNIGEVVNPNLLFDIKPWVDISDITLDQSNIIYSESAVNTKYHVVAEFKNIEHGFYLPGLLFDSTSMQDYNNLADQSFTFTANQALVENYEHYYRNCTIAGLTNPVAMHKPYNGKLPTSITPDNPVLICYSNGIIFGLFNTLHNNSPIYIVDEVLYDVYGYVQNKSVDLYPNVALDITGTVCELADTAQLAYSPSHGQNVSYTMFLYKLDHTKFKIVN